MSQIYQWLERSVLEELLLAFQVCTQLPVQIIDKKGEVLLAQGENSAFCKKIQDYLPPSKCCGKIHLQASERAIQLGESYIFPCHGNLNHIVFPLLNKTAFLGSVLVGPFLMDAPDSSLFSDLSEEFSIPPVVLLDLYDCAREVAVVPPATVQQISRLLYFLFRNILGEIPQKIISNQLKNLQQSQINDSIQSYKTGVLEKESYPYEKERLLVSKVKIGDVSSANGILNDILGYVLFSEGNSLEAIQSRSLELCSLLSRAAIEGGAPCQQLLVLNRNFLKSILQTDDLDELCIKLQEAVVTFSQSILLKSNVKQQDLIQKAAKYMADHFAERLSLEELAQHVHLNPSYFSSLFKESTGISFKEHLNRIRIEESMRLLAHTDYAIIDIATAVGYEDQSYFSKVFKKHTGLSPKEYRS